MRLRMHRRFDHGRPLNLRAGQLVEGRSRVACSWGSRKHDQKPYTAPLAVEPRIVTLLLIGGAKNGFTYDTQYLGA